MICRLLPIVPYGVVNYGAAVTRVRLLPFLAGTAVGTLPANIAYITAGNALAADADWMPMLWIGPSLAILVGRELGGATVHARAVLASGYAAGAAFAGLTEVRANPVTGR